jgi:hypothetical protein
MTTEAQMKANQENAKKSTGPTSIEGKNRSSLNAMTHGILSTITTLPGEDEAFMQSLHEDILNTYQPQDTMERCLVDRITIAMVRQVRLCQAEAAKLKLSMRPEILAESLTRVLHHTTLKRFRAEELSDQVEHNYQYYLTVLEEMKPYPLETSIPSTAALENAMPKTLSLLKSKAKEKELAWEDFGEKSGHVMVALREIRSEASNHITANRNIHLAYSLMEDMKVIHRIPQGVDITLMTRYQVQLDNDLYRAMNALQKYREHKPKVIEGEMIDEANNDESIAA